jgi:hypothetical protein
MRIKLDPGDRSLLIVSGVLLVAVSVAGVFVKPEGNSDQSAIPSSYSAGNAGAKAAYLLLGRLGYNEERWNSPPTQLPRKARNVTLILADPFLPASPEEKDAIRSFVRRGGRVVATGLFAASLLELKDVVAAHLFDPEWKQFDAQLPGPISSRVPAIRIKDRARWKGKQPDVLEYYGDRYGGAVVRFPLGSGTIVWWADASPLSNYGLTQSSNLELLLNSVGEAGKARILWDEYFHGDRPDLWSYLGKTPVPWAMLQVAILALALILTYSRRSGPIVAAAKVSRLSPMEFVETVGSLYHRKHAAQGAVEIALRRFRLLLARQPRSFADLNHAATKQVYGAGEEKLTGRALFLSQCDAAVKAGISDEAQALKIIQELHDYTRQLRLAGQGE